MAEPTLGQALAAAAAAKAEELRMQFGPHCTAIIMVGTPDGFRFSWRALDPLAAEGLLSRAGQAMMVDLTEFWRKAP